MAEIKLGLLENFAIKNWYRYLLYIGGVILILSMFLEPKGITINQVRNFSIRTIILSLVVWIAYEIFNNQIDMMDDYTIRNSRSELVIIKYALSVVGLLYWIYYIVPIIP